MPKSACRSGNDRYPGQIVIPRQLIERCARGWSNAVLTEARAARTGRPVRAGQQMALQMGLRSNRLQVRGTSGHARLVGALPRV